VITWTNHQLQARKSTPRSSSAFSPTSCFPSTPSQTDAPVVRLLTTLLLLRNQYFFVEYVPFEELLEKNGQILRCVARCQKHRNTESERIESFILFFLNCLKTLTVKLQQEPQPKATAAATKRAAEKNRDYIRREQPVKLSDLAGDSRRVSDTLKKDLQFLEANRF
jgi:Fic family protein